MNDRPPSIDALLDSPSDEWVDPARIPGDRFEALLADVEQMAVSDLGRALDAAERLVSIADRRDDHRLRAKARRALAHTLAWSNRFDEALRVIDDARRDAGLANDARTIGEIEMVALHALNRLGRSDEAASAGERALAAFARTDDAVLRARAEANLGVVLRTIGKPERALDLFDRARRTLGANPAAAAQLDSNRAEALLELDRFAEAETAFDAARATFESAGMTQAHGITVGNLADLYVRQGRFQRGLECYELACRLMGEADAPGDAARLRAEEAEAMIALGLTDDGGAALADAAARLEAFGLSWEAVRARVTQAEMHIALGDASSARSAIDGIESRVETADHRLSSTVRRVRAEVESISGDRDVARDMLRRLVETEPRSVESIKARGVLASLEDDAVARRLLDDAIVNARALGLDPLICQLLARRGMLRLHDENDDAIEDMRAAVGIAERLRGSLHADRLRAAFAGSGVAVYHDLAAALVDRGRTSDVEAALAVAEQARSRSLLDIVAGVVDVQADRLGTDDPVISGLVTETLELRRTLSALYSNMFEGSGVGTCEMRRSTATATERRLRELERRLATTRGLASVLAAPIEVDAIHDVIPSGAVLIEYLFVDGDLIVFTVRDGAVSARRCHVDRATIAEAVERIHFQCGRVLHGGADPTVLERMTRDAEAELRELYDMIVAPIATEIAGADHLHVVPHGPLHAAPFCALDDGSCPLIERYTLTTSPSATLLRHLDPRAASMNAALVCGVADDLAPAIASEVDAVAGVLVGASVLRDDDATRSAFANRATSAELIHIASHGRFDASQPAATGLRLADGWLTLPDLYDMSLRHATVVMSGCDTGGSIVGGGDDLIGLIRGFFGAGASSLLMSLWAVHDRSGAEWMRTFYRALSGGQPIASAWQTATATIRDQRPHPAFWGAFQLTSTPRSAFSGRRHDRESDAVPSKPPTTLGGP